MNECVEHETMSFYVDEELGAEESRVVESHLIGCERCRGLLLAFRDEGTAIADTLHDRLLPVDRVSRAPAHVRAKGLAIGLVPTLGVAALAVTVIGWLMESRLPLGTRWLNPMNLIGVYEMTFDMIFLLRDQAPALFEFAIAFGAMVSTASILTFLVSAVARRVIGTTALLFCLSGGLFATPPTAHAFEQRTGDGDMQVAAGETIAESLFISGDVVTIDGTVDGDLAAFAERVVLRGVVRGNVFTLGREVEILGTIEGSLHAAGERVTIEGEVGRSVYAAAESLTHHERGRAGRDVVLLGGSIHMDGETGRDFLSIAERVEVRGSVGRDVTTRSERLTVHDRATVAGHLDYEIGKGKEPDIASGADIRGGITAGELTHQIGRSENRWVDGGFYMRIVVFLASTFLVGMFLNMIRPDLFDVDLVTAGDFFRSLGYGAIALICTPIALILCMVTIIGIPIGVIGIFAYITALFVSTIIFSSLIGTSVTASLGFEAEGNHGFGVSLLVGLVVVVLAMNLPFVGGLIRLVVVMVGVGMLLDVAMDAWRHRGEARYA